MSLERMFEDLEGRLGHLEAEELRSGAEELARAERARTPLVDRLRGALGAPIAVHLDGGRRAEGRLAAIGADWLLLGEREDEGMRMLVPLEAACVIEGLPARVRAPGSERLPQPSLASMVRRIARDRSRVRVTTAAGTSQGRIVAVGQDHLDLVREAVADHRRGTPDLVTVPFGAVRTIAID